MDPRASLNMKRLSSWAANLLAEDKISVSQEYLNHPPIRKDERQSWPLRPVAQAQCAPKNYGCVA
jgi:hypothetical protein